MLVKKLHHEIEKLANADCQKFLLKFGLFVEGFIAVIFNELDQCDADANR